MHFVKEFFFGGLPRVLYSRSGPTLGDLSEVFFGAMKRKVELGITFAELSASVTDTSPYGKVLSGRGEHNGVGPSLKFLTIPRDRRSQVVSPR
jgi:hypothetical protein